MPGYLVDVLTCDDVHPGRNPLPSPSLMLFHPRNLLLQVPSYQTTWCHIPEDCCPRVAQILYTSQEMLMAHNNSKYYWCGCTMQARSTACMVTMYISHMQQGVQHTENTRHCGYVRK